MSDARKQLKELIEAAKTDKAKVAQAFDMVTSMLSLGYHEGEQMVFAVLGAGTDAPDELLDWALENFLKTRENCRGQHGYWVHSVSHFTGKLWALRPAMDKWIKAINRDSFKGANELRDSNCSDRLVSDFGQFAKWNDEPADFFLTPENLGWMDWKYAGYVKARLDHGKFGSELEFVRWQIGQPGMQKDYYGHVLVENLQELFKRFTELGGDTKEFGNLLKDLLTEELARSETALKKATEDWNKKQAQGMVDKINAALNDLA